MVEAVIYNPSMSRHEHGSIPGFRIVDNYELALEDAARDPLLVIHNTNQALELRLSDEIPSTDPIDHYLESYTIPFIDDAKRFARIKMNPLLLDADGQALTSTVGGEPTSDDELVRQKVAYDVSSYILGILPDYLSHHAFAGQPFVKPVSTAESLPVSQIGKQLDEMQRVVSLTMKGAYDNTRLTKKPASVLRTQAFFIVGASIPRLKRDQLQYDVALEEDELYHRKLEAVQEIAKKEQQERISEAEERRTAEKIAFHDLIQGIEIDL